MAKAKSKAGRNAAKCARYADSGRREANKARKIERRERRRAKRQERLSERALSERRFEQFWGHSREVRP